MGGPDHQPVILGGRLLQAAAREGQFALGRRAGTVVQVDPHPVSLLADADNVQRDCLPERAEQTRLVTSRHLLRA